MKKFFLFAAVAMLALVGCEKQNQSSLDFEQVQQSAKISGTLVYFADKAGSATVETPIANQRIFFQVDGGQYANGANGSKQFEATTGADGSFEIVVPIRKIRGGNHSRLRQSHQRIVPDGHPRNLSFLDHGEQPRILDPPADGLIQAAIQKNGDHQNRPQQNYISEIASRRFLHPYILLCERQFTSVILSG